MGRVHNPWTGYTLDRTRARGGCSPECGWPGAKTRRWAPRVVGEEERAEGGAILVLTGEREAMETTGNEREQEAAVVIGLKRLREWR
jgi:hypothetical protein